MTRDGTSNLSRDTKFSGANEDREMLIVPVPLTSSRIGNLTRLMPSLLNVIIIGSTRISVNILFNYHVLNCTIDPTK